MATMDIFEGDAFSIIELTRALDNIPFKPATLAASGHFSDRGVRTRTVVIESRDGTLSLIPFSERGAPHDQRIPERRDVRAFVCRQFKKQDVIWASEIQGIRAFGTESEASQVQVEVARRLRRLRSDAEATFEYHFLNGIQGLVKDPKDGATVVNYFTEFAITRAAGVGDTLALDKIHGDIRQGDRFLLCSDGLNKYAGFEALRLAVVGAPIETVSEKLVQMALDGGGADNISVIVVDVT